MRVNSFKGGINTRQDKFSLPVNHSTRAVNVVIDKGPVLSRLEPEVVNEDNSAGLYQLEHNGLSYKRMHNADFAEADNVVYATPAEADGKIQKSYDAITWGNAGIDRPPFNMIVDSEGEAVTNPLTSEQVSGFKVSNDNVDLSTLVQLTQDDSFNADRDYVNIRRIIDDIETSAPDQNIYLYIGPFNPETSPVVNPSTAFTLVRYESIGSDEFVTNNISIDAILPDGRYTVTTPDSMNCGINSDEACGNERGYSTLNSLALDYKLFVDENIRYALFAVIDGITNSRLIWSSPSDSIGEITGTIIVSERQFILDATVASPPETSEIEYSVQQMRTFTMTYYDDNNDIESPPLENVTTTIYNTPFVDFSYLPVSTNPLVNKKKIYYLTDGNYVLLAELDNSLTELNDVSLRAIDTSMVLDSIDNNPPTTGLKFLVNYGSILFAAKGNKVHFSRIGFYEYWPTNNFFEIEEEVTALIQTRRGLIVTSNNRSFVIIGNSIANFALFTLSNEYGCISHKSVQEIKGNPIWVSQEGIVTLAGGVVTNVSNTFLDTFYPGEVINSLMHNDEYYLSTADTIHVFDFKDTRAYRTYTSETGIISLFDGLPFEYIDAATKHSLVNGTVSQDSTRHIYETPVFGEESTGFLKNYSNVYFSIGEGVYDIEVISHTDKGTKTRNIQTSADNYRTYKWDVPGDLKRSWGLEFKFNFWGSIYEIRTEL